MLSIEVPVDVEELLLEVGRDEQDGLAAVRHHHRRQEVEERLTVADADGAEDATDALGFVESPGLHWEEVLAARPSELRDTLTLDRAASETRLERL